MRFLVMEILYNRYLFVGHIVQHIRFSKVFDLSMSTQVRKRNKILQACTSIQSVAANVLTKRFSV